MVQTCPGRHLPTKIHNELGWSPETTFDEGIKKTVDWYMNNKQWWEDIINGEYQNYYEKCIPTDKYFCLFLLFLFECPIIYF